MSLKKQIQQAFVGRVQRAEDLFSLEEYSREDHDTISALYDSGLIDDILIEEAIKPVVFKEAQIVLEDLKIRRRKGLPTYADHCYREGYLAYALSKGFFSAKEIAEIPFDHGATPDSFVEEFGREDLLARLREKFLNSSLVGLSLEI